MAITFTAASSQYLEYAGSVRNGYPVTLACWFRAHDVTTTYNLMSIGTVSGETRVEINASGNVASDPVQARSVNSAGTGSSATTSAGYTANTWYHACGVFSSSTSRVAYLDGGNSGSAPTLISLGGQDVTSVGARNVPAGHNGYFDGEIAEAAVWNVALTADEVAQLGKGFSPLLVRSNALVAYWPLIGRTDPATDRIRGQGLTWVAAPTAHPHPRIIYPRRQAFAPDYAVAATVYPELMTSLALPHRQPIVAVPY